MSGEGPLWFARELFLASLVLVLIRKIYKNGKLEALCDHMKWWGFVLLFVSFWGSSFLLNTPMIEAIVRAIVKFDYSPITPEYIALFPSVSMAYGVNLLLYGVIGMAFSGFLFINEKDRIGFILQNLIYFVLTGLVWVPIVTFLWQLWRYPQALIITIICFVITDAIMMVVGYRETKKNIEVLNKALENL